MRVRIGIGTVARNCLIDMMILCTIVLATGTSGWSQVPPGGFYQPAVGGISIQANGLVENATTEVLGNLSRLRSQTLRKAPAGLNDAVPLRKVSLRGIDEALAASLKEGKPLPEEILFLGGLLGIRYVFVYPEQRDVVLAGPAEGWKVDRRGNVIGLTSGRPVMLLDNLLVALRTADSTARTGITCSIDPTPEGVQRLRSHVSTLHTIGNPDDTATGIEQALGMQQIAFHGGARHKPLRRSSYCGRLPDETLGDELRSLAGAGIAEFLADDQRRRSGYEQYDAALVAGANVRIGAPGSGQLGMGIAGRGRKVHDGGRFPGDQRQQGTTGAVPIPWPRNGPTI